MDSLKQIEEKNKMSKLDNIMYKFDNNFCLYLKKTNKFNIYGHYELEQDDKYREVKLIYFKDIYQIILDLNKNQICVDIDFVNENNKIESTEYTSGMSRYYFNNFELAYRFVNQITEFSFGKSMFEENINFNPNPIIDSNSVKLNNLESALLTNSFAVKHSDNICVSELLNNGTIKYYYDIKIFKLEDKNVFMFYDCKDGYFTKCKIIFFNQLIMLKSNQDKYINAYYCIELLDVDTKNIITIGRLSKDKYLILTEWIQNKLE